MENSEQQDPEFLKNEAYDNAADLKTRIRIQDRYRTNPQDWFHWLFERLDLLSNSHILELGCGSGDLWEKNRDRLQPGWKVLLSDFSAGMLAGARAAAPGRDPRFMFSILDAQSIPIRSNYFDAVLGIGLLDHLPQRRSALGEIRRVLKPGGRFYASAGGHTHLREFAELVKPFLPEADFGGDPERFGIENGEEILSPWFSQIRLERYLDELVFTQAEPILDYVLSEAKVKAKLAGERKDRFALFLRERLASQGAIRVRSDKGLFEAIKA